MILVNGGGSVTYTEPSAATSAYRDCYAACRARGGTIEQCQLECDPAFTGWNEEPRFDGGDPFWPHFIGGVQQDVRALPGVVGGAVGEAVQGATGGSLQSLLIIGLIGAALILAIQLT